MLDHVPAPEPFRFILAKQPPPLSRASIGQAQRAFSQYVFFIYSGTHVWPCVGLW